MFWDGCSKSDSNLVESLQIEGARVTTGALQGTRRRSLLNEPSWVDLSVRRKLHKLSLMYLRAIHVQTSFLTDLGIFAYLTFVLIGIKNLFFFHQLNGATIFR